MNRNQKIALGCGGAGCLGLIVVVIAGGLIWYFATGSLGSNSNRSTIFPSNANRSVNRNANTGEDSNTNASSESNSATTTTTSLSDDEQHRLFHAASVTGDAELDLRVWKKLGLYDQDGRPRPGFQKFVEDHAVWLIRNLEFASSVGTREKARAYVEAHIDD